MDTIVIFSPAPGPNSSAMAADTNAVYWYAPDSVQESGGVISAWNDKSGNAYHLGQIGSMPMPSYNASGYVEFDGTEIIGDSTFAFANTLKASLDAGNGAAIFIVAGALDWSGQTVNTVKNYAMWCEGTSPAVASNQTMDAHVLINTFNTPRTGDFNFSNREFSPAFLTDPAESEAQQLAASANTFLLQMTADQSNAAVDINDGTITASEAVTAANLASSGTGLYLGSLTNDNATVADPWIGRIYEVFGTTDNSTSNVNAIRAELAAKYSI